MKITLPQITPGPWRVEGTELIDDIAPGALPHAVVRDPSDKWTALVEITDNEGEANAQAIAALPDLLAALANVLQRIEDSDTWWIDSPTRGGFDAEAIRAALLKAGATIAE